MVLLIKKEGLFTSVQDLGRFGLQRFGINPRGAMDRTALRVINLLLGNDESWPALEFHFPGPEIVFEGECRFALGGADFAAELDGASVSNWHTYAGRKWSVLNFGRKVVGNRCYLAIDGGVKCAPSAADESADVPDFVTRRLRKGQGLTRHEKPLSSRENCGASRSLLPAYSSFPIVRITAGAEFERLSDEHKQTVEMANFAISNDSNRMGFRLRGPELSLADPIELASAAVCFGTIQLLPDGQLIVLMADHQTSGGYPRVGHVISSDLPLVAQLGPGDKLAFKIIDIAEAERISARLEAGLKKLKLGVGFGHYW
jgi:antagonist of KipI